MLKLRRLTGHHQSKGYHDDETPELRQAVAAEEFRLHLENYLAMIGSDIWVPWMIANLIDDYRHAAAGIYREADRDPAYMAMLVRGNSTGNGIPLFRPDPGEKHVEIFDDIPF